MEIVKSSEPSPFRLSVSANPVPPLKFAQPPLVVYRTLMNVLLMAMKANVPPRAAASTWPFVSGELRRHGS